jgi:uncharacterized membrane-anchored protein
MGQLKLLNQISIWFNQEATVIGVIVHEGTGSEA